MDVRPLCYDNEDQWELTFADHFEGGEKDWEQRWKADASPFTHILCSRWPENVKQENSLLYLMNKKEARGGQDWTSGSVQTLEEFQYGFFECRMKYAAQTGLNQSFWIMTNPAYSAGGVTFELDINEGHYPSEIACNYHYMQNGVPLSEGGLHLFDCSQHDAGMDLSQDFHVYGCLWTKEIIKYYFDGKPIRSMVNTFAHAPAPVRLSSAIVTWSGPVTDAIDGTRTEYDYVRVFRQK